MEFINKLHNYGCCKCLQLQKGVVIIIHTGHVNKQLACYFSVLPHKF